MQLLVSLIREVNDSPYPRMQRVDDMSCPFKSKFCSLWGIGPYDGADFNLVLSHSWLQSQAPPQQQQMPTTVSPIIQKCKKIRKGKVQEKERKGGGSWLYV